MPTRSATAKRSRKDAAPEAPKRFDEVNVGKLGLISIQERVPENHNRWSVAFELEDGRPAKLACVVPEGYGGVPHGLDNDISGALIDLFIEQGAPEDGSIQTTAYQILQRAMLQHTGRYYAALHESLQRLKVTMYTASDSWRDQTRKRWVTKQFNYVTDLEYSSDNDDQQLGKSSVIKLKLGEPIVASVRARYIKPIDERILSALVRPNARSLYRLLDARRHNPDEPAGEVIQFESNLVQWARECKIVNLEAHNIRRVLEPAHEDLIACGYLKVVEYEGRGTRQRVRYTFGSDQDLLSPNHDTSVDELQRRGVGRKVAEELVGGLGAEAVRDRLDKALHIIRSGYKPAKPTGFIVDVIREDTNKYPDPPDWTPPSRRARARPSTPPAPTEATDPAEEAQRYLDELEQQGPEAVAALAIQRLDLLARKKLSTVQRAAIQAALDDGRLNARDVITQATRALVNGTTAEFLRELLAYTSPQPPMLGAFKGERER